MSQWIAVGSVALAICGCSRPGDGGIGLARDSAGVTIVESRAPGSSEAISIDSLPVVDVGGGETDLRLDFGPDARPRFLSDGRLIVTNQREGQLKFFDPFGRWIRSVGRKGSGPGEFLEMRLLGVLHGDTIAIFDPANQRITLFDSAGGSMRAMVWAGGEGDARASPHEMFPDGTVLAIATGIFPLAQTATIWRDTVSATVVDLTGQRITTVGRFPGAEFGLAGKSGRLAGLVEGAGPSSWNEAAAVGEAIAMTGDIAVLGLGNERISRMGTGSFHKQGFFAALDTLVLIADNASFGFDIYTRDGGLIRRARRQFTAASVTDSDAEALTAQNLRRLPPEMASMENEIRKGIQRVPRPKFKPAYDRLLVSETGEVWTREFIGPGEGGRDRYAVFDAGGRWLETVPMPEGFLPTWIGRQAIVGIWQDQDDVVHVRVHRRRAAKQVYLPRPNKPADP